MTESDIALSLNNLASNYRRFLEEEYSSEKSLSCITYPSDLPAEFAYAFRYALGKVLEYNSCRLNTADNSRNLSRSSVKLKSLTSAELGILDCDLHVQLIKTLKEFNREQRIQQCTGDTTYRSSLYFKVLDILRNSQSDFQLLVNELIDKQNLIRKNKVDHIPRRMPEGIPEQENEPQLINFPIDNDPFYLAGLDHEELHDDDFYNPIPSSIIFGNNHAQSLGNGEQTQVQVDFHEPASAGIEIHSAEMDSKLDACIKGMKMKAIEMHGPDEEEIEEVKAVTLEPASACLDCQGAEGPPYVVTPEQQQMIDTSLKDLDAKFCSLLNLDKSKSIE